MKKILLATAAVALTAGAAAADGVVLSGYGRFGVQYESDWANKLQVTSRFRLNIAATKTTDTGVQFGVKFRLQHSQNGDVPTANTTTNSTTVTVGSSSAAATYTTPSTSMMTPNAMTAWAKAGAFTVEVGNVADVVDASGTYYNGDIGLNGYGDQEVLSSSGFIGYASGPTPTNQVGVLATYAANGLTVRASAINPNQTYKNQPAGVKNEYGIGVDYSMGNILVGAGYVDNVGFVDGDKAYFVSGQYSFGKSTVGLQVGRTTATSTNQGTLFGSTDLGNGLGLQGYITKATGSKTGAGLGMSYDLGGATLLGSINRLKGDRTTDSSTYVDLGVKFDF